MALQASGLRPSITNRPLWLGALQRTAFVVLAGCSVHDPAVFDERLRAATFDHHARAIGLQLGASRVDCTEQQLAAAFRARAVAAATPAEFERVLVEMLLALRDPHVDFVPADQPWRRLSLGGNEVIDDAQPEFADVVRSDDCWWIAVPRPNATASTELGQRLLASIGDASAAPTWQRLVALDGLPIHSRSDAKLLLRGPLLQPVQATLADAAGAHSVVALPRNALRVVRGSGILEVVPPRQLASWCDPGRAAKRTPSIVLGAADPLDTFARSRAANLRADAVLQPCRGFGAGRDLQVWRDGNLGFLRLGSMQVVGDVNDTYRALDAAMAALVGCDALIVDLLDNHGGDWVVMGYAASAFLPAGSSLVPHRGERRIRTDGWLMSTVEILDARLRRAPVPELRPTRLVVLVDQWTASAAEILAAVLRCKAGAQLIGERTTGAETWVHEESGPDGSRILFGLPGGMSDGCEGFQGRGLLPDVEVVLSADRLQAVGLDAARREHRRAVRAAAFTSLGVDPAQVLAPD